MNLRVATYNIRNGRTFDGFHSWPFRRWATAATIEELDADIVGLQEVYRFQDRYLRRRLGGYEGVWCGRSRDGRGGEGCPVLFRPERARLVTSGTRWFGPFRRARFPRIATTCRFEVDGRLVDVTNLHLDAQYRANRVASIEQLGGWLDHDGASQIVLGDFNARPDDALFDHLPLRAIAVEGGTNHDFTGRADGPRIDHILVSEDLEVVDAAVVRPPGRLGSDHWPVVAEVSARR